MGSLILAIVVFILGLILASWVYFTDKSATKKAKLVILIIVFIAAGAGVGLEIVKYQDEKAKDGQLADLAAKYSQLDSSFKKLKADYDGLTVAYNKLNQNYTDIQMAIKNAKLSYDSNTKQINNIGNIKNANLGNMSGGHVGDDYNGMEQRKLSADRKQYIIKNIPGLNTHVRILYPANDKESANLANQVEEYLKKSGYTNILSKVNPDPAPNCFDSIICGVIPNSTDIEVRICPQTNTSH